MGAGRDTRDPRGPGTGAITFAAGRRRAAGTLLLLAGAAAGCGGGTSAATTATAAATTAATTTASAAQAPTPGFGAAGLVALRDGTQLQAAAVQPDGKLLVTGLQGGISAPRLLLMRLLASGTPDPAFGRGGIATAPAGGAIGRALALRPDGRILVGGDVLGAGGPDGMFAARFTARGALDRSFGRRGVTRVLRGSQRRAQGHALGVRRDGSIVLGGAAGGGDGVVTPAVAFLRADGTLRRSVRVTSAGAGVIEALALRRDGRILVAGAAQRVQFTLGFLGRLTAGGAVDRGFGGGIRVRQYARQAASSALRAVAVLPGGRVLATGYALDGTGAAGSTRILVRTDAAGRGTTVRRTAAARGDSIDSGQPAGGTAIAVGQRRVYVVGSWDEAGSSAMATQALRRDGTIDRGFGTRGQLLTPFRDYALPLYATGAALGRDVLYAVGTAGITPARRDSTTGVVARIAVAPTPPPGPEVRE